MFFKSIALVICLLAQSLAFAESIEIREIFRQEYPKGLYYKLNQTGAYLALYHYADPRDVEIRTIRGHFVSKIQLIAGETLRAFQFIGKGDRLVVTTFNGRVSTYDLSGKQLYSYCEHECKDDLRVPSNDDFMATPDGERLLTWGEEASGENGYVH